MLDYLLTDAWVPPSSLFSEGVGRASGFATIQDTGESRLALTLLGDYASGDVPIISLTEAVERMGYKIDLLKLDCHGAEWDIFQEPRVVDRIRNIRLEYHLIQGHSVGDLERIITDLGFRIDRWIPNCSWLFACSTWRPERTLREIVMDTADWASRCEKSWLRFIHQPRNEENGITSSRKKAPPLNLLSVVIPARDEAGCIAATAKHLQLELELNNIAHEIVVVDDGSADATWSILQELAVNNSALRPVSNEGPHGFGRAVIKGIDAARGDAIIVMMADESDDCRDVVRYWQALNEGWDCVFGDRFIRGGGVIGYPWLKLRINRLANFFIRFLFRISLNDTTNAFKAYRKTVLDGCRPFLASFQSHCGIAIKSDRARVFMDCDPCNVAESA